MRHHFFVCCITKNTQNSSRPAFRFALLSNQYATSTAKSSISKPVSSATADAALEEVLCRMWLGQRETYVLIFFCWSLVRKYFELSCWQMHCQLTSICNLAKECHVSGEEQNPFCWKITSAVPAPCMPTVVHISNRLCSAWYWFTLVLWDKWNISIANYY